MFRRLRNWILRPVVWLLAIIGLVTVVLGGMIAIPVKHPPALPSISEGARAIDREGLPEPSRFVARDGTALAYRLYPATGGDGRTIAIVIHGSAGHSVTMNAIGKALAAGGITAVAPDLRGHGLSGTRGDIGYIGQLEDDLADLVASLRQSHPEARFVLAGHSSGGGFALRVAAGPGAKAFDRFVLLAPYLGPFAPSTRQSKDAARWAEADVPRIIALSVLQRAGIRMGEALPVIAFALAPGAEKFVTTQYSYRLLADFGPPTDLKTALARVRAPVTILAGGTDELMDSQRYAETVQGAATKMQVRVLPGIDHMGIIYKPEALPAIVTAIKGE